MNDISKWIDTYRDQATVVQIGIPVLCLLGIVLTAFLLWAASKIAKQEQFRYLNALSIAVIEAVVMTGVFWGLLKVFDVPRIQALENLSTALPLAAVFWPIHLVLVTGLLIALGRISILPALL